MGATLANPVPAFEPTDLMAYKMGPVLLRPRLAAGARYDDNIYYRSSGPLQQGDFISVISPGLTLTLGRPAVNNPWFDLRGAGDENYLSLSYNFDQSMYATHGDLDSGNHTVDLSYRLKGYRLIFQGSDRIQMLTAIIGGGNNLGLPIKRTTFGDNYTLSYKLTEKTSVYANGTLSATEYEKGTPLFNDNYFRGTLGFAFGAFSKTSFFGEIYDGQAAVSPNRSSDPDGPHERFLGGFIGMRGDFTPRLSGSMKVGYETHEFSNHAPVADSPVVEGNLKYRFREKSVANLGYTRSTAVSVQAAGVSYNSDTVYFRLDQNLGRAGKWMAFIGGNYQLANYDPTGIYANRQDDWLQLNCGLTYLMRAWLATNLGYEYERFTSTATRQGVIDYTANRVTLRIAVGY